MNISKLSVLALGLGCFVASTGITYAEPANLRLALGAYFSGDRDTLVPVMAEKLEQLDADKIEALVNYYAGYRP